jgi:hypothetical protein
MKFYLIHEEPWDLVSVEPVTEPAGASDRQRDSGSLSKIGLPQCLVHLQGAETTKAAWEALQSAFEDKGMNRRCILLGKFSIKLKHYTSMDSYVTEVLSTAQETATIGKRLDDDLIAILLLQGLTSDYKPMRMVVENSGIELTTDYVKTKLLQEEYNPKNKESESGSESALSLQNRAWNRDTTKYHGKVSQGTTRVVNSSQSSNLSRYKPGSCFICNRTGHKAANCYKNPNRKNLQKG